MDPIPSSVFTNLDVRLRIWFADGTAWGTPIAADIEGDVGLYTSLIELDGQPAISHYDAVNGDLKFFIQMEKRITINWIAVEP